MLIHPCMIIIDTHIMQCALIHMDGIRITTCLSLLRFCVHSDSDSFGNHTTSWLARTLSHWHLRVHLPQHVFVGS